MPQNEEQIGVFDLDVDWIRQNDAYSCVPRCLKMVMDYLNNSILSDKLPDFSVIDLERIVATDSSGTDITHVNNVNKHIGKTTPSVDFDSRYVSRSFSDIEEALRQNTPTIAWLELVEHGREYFHAVVVKDLNLGTHEISYVDPMKGHVKEPISSFMAKWEKADRLLIKVEIGKRIQRRIDSYQVGAVP